MKILVLNCGSSSVKYRLFENGKELVAGLVEKVGEKNSRIKTYRQALELMIKQLAGSVKINLLDEIKVVAHRVVHGGRISKPSIITPKILQAIKKFSLLAPLHNLPSLSGIIEMQKLLPKAKHIAVFDTSFHQTMPEYSYLYALPYEFCKKHGIRKYGFHGTSHKYVSQRACELLEEKPEKLNIITCHLGAGCSITAVKKGKVIDTSMGFTPLEGLIMGTRAGDIDAGVLVYLARELKMKPDEIDDLLNKKSGLLGISGIGKDFREIFKHAEKGNQRCQLALEMFCYRIKKYIGAYAAALGKVDAVVFTAGIGENNAFVRAKSSEIECLGIKIDKSKNQSMAAGKEGIISPDNSKIKVLVIPTDEEKMIAIEAKSLAG